MRERHRPTSSSLLTYAFVSFAMIGLTVSDTLAQPPFRTFVGQSPAGNADGLGTNARFNYPNGVAVDGAGTVYIADVFNCVIRKMTAAGAVTTFVGEPMACGSADGTGSAARFQFPEGIAVDSAGTVYVADSGNSTIRKITAAGVVTTLAGLAGNPGPTDGTGSVARFRFPRGIAVDGAGNIYVADTFNSTIRSVTPGGVVTTLAGVALSQGATNGTGSAARFAIPEAIAADSAGVLYVADTNNHTIRKITAGAVVTTFVGTAGLPGGNDGTGAFAGFRNPRGLAVDSAGTIYVGDSNNATIRQVTSAGVVTTVAGVSALLGGADGTGNGARFSLPQGVAVNNAGVIYVADTTNDTIRKITSGGVVTTLAGYFGSMGATDGSGHTARFGNPIDIAVDPNGNFYVADQHNHTIRKITPWGLVTTFAGLPGSSGTADGTGSAARFRFPRGVAVNSAGIVYVADTGSQTIRQITPEGVVTTLAGLASSTGSTDGTGSVARFNNPYSIAVDGSGTLYVADANNHTIRQVTPAGVVTTLAGLALTSGDVNGTGSAARFSTPRGVAADSAGTVYVADAGNAKIRRITAGGVVTTLAGSGFLGNVDGPGATARFYFPGDVAVDAAGTTAYVADTSNSTIRQISTSTGVVATMSGSAAWVGGENTGRFNFPQGIGVDALGFVYVGDTKNNTIRTNAPIRTNAGDFDGDWKTDVTVFRPGSGTWYVLNSSTNYSTFNGVNWGSSTDVPVPADYDGDSKTDIAIFRPSTGQWWISFSASAYTTFTSYQWGLSTDVPVPADYDGDGKADIVIFRPSIGTWFGLMSGDGYAPDSLTWGADGDVPVPGDYDGDGFTDIAVFRPSTGQWWALLSSENYEDYRAFNWGTSGDVPVPADYDGDGQTDVAIFRPSSGIWYILTSASNYTTFISRPWGVSTDVPVPGDYDGDGTADISIYRDGVWYVLTSTSNFTTYMTFSWGAGGDVPVLRR